MRWGAAELRSPHPLIDLRYIPESAADLLPPTPTIEALHAMLCCDQVGPSRLFSLDYYRSQLDDTAATPHGLLHHFLQHGLLVGLRPHAVVDPVAAYRLATVRTFDVRSALRHLALSKRAPNSGKPLPTADQVREDDAKAPFRDRACALLPTRGHH